MVQYAITTFGCQMNVHDSERMHGVLRAAGLEEAADEKSADVLVLNTCSVREKAEQKLLSLVGRIAKEKRERPDLVLVVAGCVAQQEGERLLARSGGAIDIVVGPDNLGDIPRLLEEIAGGAPPMARTVFDLDEPRFLASPAVRPVSPGGGAAGGPAPGGAGSGAATDPGATVGPTAFVTTMKGCNERCSFCIVPYTRGPERYRPSAEILDEIAALVDRGVREVTLLGQTVNSYRDPTSRLAAAPGARPDDPDESEFAALLRAVAAEVPGLLRLRYTSPHPRHLVPSLIRAHAELDVLCRHVHLPVQSGSDRLLKRMIRRYTRAEYLERIGRLRAEVPGVTLSTDVIVGFPGETEEDFAETLSLVREAGFIGLFGFAYSQRPYTPARKLADDVPEAEKKARLARLFARSEEQLAAHLETLVGSEQVVLVEGLGKMASRPGAPEAWAGRTRRSEIVHLDDPACAGLVGEEIHVRVTRANKHSVAADVAPADQARGLAALAARPAAGPRRRGLPVVSQATPPARELHLGQADGA